MKIICRWIICSLLVSPISVYAQTGNFFSDLAAGIESFAKGLEALSNPQNNESTNSISNNPTTDPGNPQNTESTTSNSNNPTADSANKPPARDYEREAADRRARALEWENEKRAILNSSKSFNVEVICTDDVYVSARTGYVSRGDSWGINAVSAYYSMGANVNPNAYAAFSKTPYICKSQSSKFETKRLDVIGRAPGGRYVVKIDGKNLYSAIK
jgi:hypothetical protein